MAAWELGGKFRMSVEMVWNVPQVQGKLAEFRDELMEGVGLFSGERIDFE